MQGRAGQFVRQHDANREKRRRESDGGGKTANDEKWALASFFGEAEHALLHLQYDARGILKLAHTGKLDKHLPGNYAEQTEEGDIDVTSLSRRPLASVDVSLALALAEQSERKRCKAWSRLTLHRPDHPLALLSYDEYSLQLHLEKRGLPVTNGSGSPKSDHGEISNITNSKQMCATVDRARVGLHVAHSTGRESFSLL